MTDSASTHRAVQVQGPPGTGGRVELRLRVPTAASSAAPGAEQEPPSDTSPAAIYSTLWATAEGRWEGELWVSQAGQVTVVPNAVPPGGEPAENDGPPKWLADFSAHLVRTTARSVLGAGGTWPRRLTRWRAAPESP